MAIPIASAVLCAALIVVLRPWLVRYALARPNARSSHSVPTPQGGGIAIIAATVVVIALAELATGALAGLSTIGVVLTAAAFLAVIGAIDDLRPISVLPRLVLQIAAAAAVLAVLPTELRVVPWLPYGLERALLLVATLWFVNLVNFMDGLDWMTVAEMLPVTVALVAFGFVGAMPSDSRRHRGSRSPARCSASRRSTGRSRGCSWAMSEACRSGFCSAWCLLQLAWTRPSCRGAAAAALLPRRRDGDTAPAATPPRKSSGSRIARISISAPPTTASRSSKWCAKYSYSTSVSRGWPLASIALNSAGGGSGPAGAWASSQ